MRIGVDITILEKRMSGIRRYTEGILQGISKIKDDKNQYFLFCIDEMEDKWHQEKFKIIPTGRDIIISKKIYSLPPFWLNFVLPKYLQEYKIDLCFFPTHFCPLVETPAKNVIAIHDMAHCLDKRSKNWWRKIYINFFLNQSVNRASGVVTVSENSRKDILKIYPGISSRKVSVIHNAADKEFKVRDVNELPEDKTKNLRKRYSLPQNFVLYVGKIEERKNIRGILKIADIFYKFNPKVIFVLIGDKGYVGYKALKKKIDKRKNKNVLHIDYIDDRDLPYIYNLAKIFLFPSFYEGFGLPALEAMQSGLPVLTSDTSSLPEIVAKGGLMHSPYDCNGFARDLTRLMEDKDFYLRMRERALNQAKKFKWRDSAEKTITFFRDTICRK